jgi:hypothetical protein
MDKNTKNGKQKEESEKFGMTVKLLNDDSVLIFSSNGDSEIDTTFDIYSATLPGFTYVNDPASSENEMPMSIDNGTLRIVDIKVDTGRVDVYEKINNNYIFAETLYSSVDNDETDLFIFLNDVRVV